MRILIHSGFFKLKNIDSENSQEGYVLTLASRLLLKNSPLDSTSLVLLDLDPALAEPHNHLSTFFKNDDQSSFQTAFGDSLWSYTGREEKFNKLVNEAMASDSVLISKAMIIKCRNVFEGLESLVDVGDGTVAKAIFEAFPNINCTVSDLPHVVADLQGSKNLNFLAGDMFQAIPPADAILLKWVMHDWSDEHCIKILKNYKEAIMEKGKKGKVIIIDVVNGHQAWDDRSTEAQLFFDISAMPRETGKQRTEKEWAQLLFDAGYTNYKIHPVLGPRALVEVYP